LIKIIDATITTNTEIALVKEKVCFILGEAA
jgi:hypothetical protein